jgi:hypothetical protein
MGARGFKSNQRFEILTRLGRGGMGTVYQVIDHARQSRLALKSVGKVEGEALERLKREFHALSAINHPNIVELGELLEQDGAWSFTMELVAGTEFLAYVRDADFDEARLRRSLGQLAEGLHTLHLHGQVHRDIKPSNVLVTHEGRVVIIDFGLATEWRGATPSAERQAVGTVGYMAPEQAAGQTVGPESDWYAFGVLLYEALTGRLPLEGTGLQVLMRKQTEVPARPRELSVAVPEDLDALCMELLRIDPRQRPRGRAILERLHVDTSFLKPVSTTISLGEPSEELVGRDAELAQLERELAQVARGQQRVVTLLGESGHGKSALLRRFARRLEAGPGDALVLRGSCHEHDATPYRALDGAMDQLARWLTRLAPEHAATMSEDVAILERAFPRLSRLPAIADARRSVTEVRDPQERRLQVMRALRSLFDRVARRVPLVVAIDDLQWSDHDSMRMLAQLIGPPHPPPLLLLCATSKPEVDPALQSGSVLRLAPLPPERSLELARRTARHLGLEGAAEAVAQRAAGSPLLIEVLLHQIGEPRNVARDLDEAIGRSLGALDEPARRLLEALCAASLPITQRIAAEVVGLEAVELAPHIRTLRICRLVRSSGPLNTDTVEPYHEQIREAVLRRLPEAQREPLHDALARALETDHAEPYRLAHHLRQGGEPRRATACLLTAADRARDALAFERAAEFHAEALAMQQVSAEERRRLLIARGSALALAGRGRSAALAFTEALPGSSAAKVLELRMRIAEQLLHAGYYQEGAAACDAFVEGLGIHAPKSPGRVLLGLIVTNAWLWVRGLRTRVRGDDQLSPHEVSRVDAYWAMAKGLAAYEPIRAQLFHARGLLSALRAGEPYRLSRAIALSALSAMVISPGARARADARLAAARKLAEGLSNPYVATFIDMMHGLIDVFGHCRWQRGVERLVPAEATLRAHCEEAAWEVDLCSAARRECQFMLGHWQALSAGAPEACKEAETRGNRYSLVHVRAEWMSFAATLAGDFTAARREVDEAIDPSDRNTSPVEAILHLISHLRIDLWEGARQKALARLDGYRPGLARRLAMSSTVMRALYEATAVNVLLASAGSEQGRTAQLLRARAHKLATRLERRGVECTTPLSALARAALRAARGDDEAALRLLAEAESGFQAEGMLAYLAAARLRRGALLGGEAGRTLVEQGAQFFASQGVRDVAGALRLLAAGFPADRQGA